jgi:CHAT domain-containing protein
MKNLVLLYCLVFTSFACQSRDSITLEMERYLFDGKYNEGINWIIKEKAKKGNLALLNQYEGDFYKSKGDLEEALVHWKESNRIRSKQYEANDYHLAWNYALLSNYYYEKIEIELAKKYADSCTQLIEHLTLKQEREIEIFNIWNILAQSEKLYFANNLSATEVLVRYKWIRGFYSKSKRFILENKLPEYYLAKTYHLIGNSYHDNIHAHIQMNAESHKILETLRNAMIYYSLADETWTKNYGLVHHERAKTLYLMGMVNLLLNEKILPNRLTISSNYFDQAIKAFGIDLNLVDENSLKRIPNKEDAIRCLRYKNQSLFMQIAEKKKISLIPTCEKISRQATKLWEITFSEFKSSNTNQLLGIYNLIPFKDIIEIETLKRKFNLPFSLERIFNANEKLKYYDFNKLQPIKITPKVSLKSLQKKLNEGDLFLDFLTGQGTNHFVLAISHSNVSLIKLNDSIPEYINDLKKSIIEMDFNNYVKFGTKTYSAIFNDLDLKNYKKIVICPEGNVNDLVFEALLPSSKNSNLVDYRQLDYLVKHFQLQYTLSSSIYLKKIESIPLNIAAFAPFNPNKKYAELPFSSQLMDKLSDLNQLVYKNETATANNFLKTKSSILHFSGHGSIDEQSPTLSSLVFSDRTLNLSEIPLIQNPKLVVLNACNSSNGKIIQGDGVNGFVRAFHAAGADVTIANLWEVDDKVSNELFSKFYGALKHKRHISKLMQQTKIEHINGCSQSELAAPYYWAGHRVMGDGEIAQNKKTPQSFIYLWIVGVLVVVAYFICRSTLKSS